MESESDWSNVVDIGNLIYSKYWIFLIHHSWKLKIIYEHEENK